MKIFEASQIKDIDQYTLVNEPVSSLDLMERAATAFTKAVVHRWGRETPVVVFAGPGNNGGDALAVSRLLTERGYEVRVYLFNPDSRLSPDCEANRSFLYGVVKKEYFFEITKGVRVELPVLTPDMLVIDGLFGIGLNRPLEGGFAAVVQYINKSGVRVASIDIPSGLMTEDNTDNKPECIIRATYTYTFQTPKLAFLFPENAVYVGKWETLDIQLSEEGLQMMEASYHLTEEPDIRALVHPLSHFAHKGIQGHALLIAGSQGMAGAAVLAARACLRSGVGKLTVYTPSVNNAILQISVPEALVKADPFPRCFSQAVDVSAYNAVAIGPGLGMEMETRKAFGEQLYTMKKPLVLDADALNMLSGQLPLLHGLPSGTILTPHPKELERLVGPCQNTYERLQMARELSTTHQLFIVLKGANSAVICPDGNVFFNPTGNPGMATAGSGDVLTGILVSLLAQGYSPKQSALLGVYLHGLAGDIAARETGMRGMTSGDLAAYLPQAWKELEK